MNALSKHSPSPAKTLATTSPTHCTGKEQCIFLCEALVNMELLYLKAKLFHWNVKGCDFKQNHETYDEIQEVALDSADRIAERHRFLGDPVDNTVATLDKCRWFPDGTPTLTLEEMKIDMVKTLDCINVHLMQGLKIQDDVTSNILQDICGAIDKMNYFMRSSLEKQ